MKVGGRDGIGSTRLGIKRTQVDFIASFKIGGFLMEIERNKQKGLSLSKHSPSSAIIMGSDTAAKKPLPDEVHYPSMSLANTLFLLRTKASSLPRPIGDIKKEAKEGLVADKAAGVLEDTAEALGWNDGDLKGIIKKLKVR